MSLGLPPVTLCTHFAFEYFTSCVPEICLLSVERLCSFFCLLRVAACLMFLAPPNRCEKLFSWSVHLIEWKQSAVLIINKQTTVCVCPQAEALSDAVSVRRRGAGAAGRRRWRWGPEGGWLRQRGVALLHPAPRWRLLGLPLCPHHRLSGHQDEAGVPGAREQQHQEEAQDLWDQGEGFSLQSWIIADFFAN